MCGGVTAYVACKRSNVRPGQWVVIPGAGGGLGHFGIQYAKHMGMRVIAIDGGDAKRDLCLKLGAEKYTYRFHNMRRYHVQGFEDDAVWCSWHSCLSLNKCCVRICAASAQARWYHGVHGNSKEYQLCGGCNTGAVVRKEIECCRQYNRDPERG